MTLNKRRATAALLLLSCLTTNLSSENVTLTTYYPAPSGIYTKLITTGDTVLARDGGNVDVLGGLSAPLGATMDMHDHRIKNLANPINAQDAVSKAYVDAASGGPTGWICTVRASASAAMSANVSCVGREKIIVGGCVFASGGSVAVRNAPLSGGQGWSCTSSSGNVQAWANCCL